MEVGNNSKRLQELYDGLIKDNYDLNSIGRNIDEFAEKLATDTVFSNFVYDDLRGKTGFSGSKADFLVKALGSRVVPSSISKGRKTVPPYKPNKNEYVHFETPIKNVLGGGEKTAEDYAIDALEATGRATPITPQDRYSFQKRNVVDNINAQTIVDTAQRKNIANKQRADLSITGRYLLPEDVKERAERKQDEAKATAIEYQKAEKAQRQQIDDTLRSLKEKAQKDYNDYAAQLREQEEKIPAFIRADKDAYVSTTAADLAMSVPAATLKLVDDTEKLLNAPKKGGNWANSMWAGAKDAADAESFFSFGLSGLAKSATIKGVTDRYLEGKNLTDKENDLMEALATNTLVAYMRKDDVSGWYTAGQIAEMSAEISTQFLGTNFIGSAATKAVARGIGKFISKNAPKIVAKLATKGLGGTALRGTRFVGKGAIDTFVGGTAQSLFMPNTYDSAIQTKTGTVAFGEGKGQYDVTPSEYNLAQSLVSGAIESVSERAGGAFAGFGGKVAKNIIPTSWGKLSSKGIVGDIIKAGGTANRYLSKAGINGQFGELAEEGFGQVLNRINGTATKEEWANFWSKDNMLQMIGGFAPMSLVGLGANTISVAKSSLDAYRADRALLNFARQNNIAAPKKMLDEIKNVEIENLHKVIEEYVQELGGVSDNKLNDIGVEFNKLAANVVAHNIRKDIYAEADSEISPAESVSTDERQEVTEENIQEERQPDYTIPQLRQGDEVEYDNAQWIVGDVADEDGDYQVGEESIPLRRGNVLLLGADGESVQVIDSAADLYPKQQNVDDEIESKRQAIYEQYRPVMNVDTGNITQLSNVAGTDNIAYVVKGKVVYDEDGNIDYDRSDDTIYYKVYDKDGNEVDGGTPKPIYLKTRRTEFGKVLSDVPIEEYVDNELYPQEQNNIRQATNNGQTNIEQSTPAESVSTGERQDITEKNDSTEFDENGGYSNIQNTVLSDEEADLLMSAMEQNAEAMPVIELTPDNWVAEFGQNRTVSTPIGDVKMGDNQLAKLFLKKRTREFGMIKPTLINPDVIIEKTAVADNAERNTKLLFVKTFKDENGRKHVHFENVTVQKGGLEVSISSHIVDKSAIRKELANGIVIYNKPELTSIGSDVYLTETHEGQSDLVPTQKANSDLQYKGTINNLNEQGEFYNSLPRNKKGEVDENQMSAEQKIMYAQIEFGQRADLVRDYVAEQSKALSEKIAKLTNKTGKSVAEYKELAAMQEDKNVFVEYLNEQRQQQEQATPRRTVEEAAAEREERRAAEKEQREQAIREKEEREGVPDFMQDTPEDARLRGFRLRTGERIDRQEPITLDRYNTARRKFTNDTGAVEGGRPTVKRTIIDNAQTKLQPSHRGGRSNIYHFITEAQPKERTDKASRVSAAQIAANINPEEITGGITAYNGSPIANNRLEVIQGNNRAEALRLMYEEYPKSAEAYKQYLIDNAENYGMSADEVRTMKEPIAVDIYEGTDGDAILLGQYTQQDVESGGVHRINPSGVIKHLKSQNMLDRFITGLLKGVDEENTISDVISANLRDVLPILDKTGAISMTQRQGFFDERGDVTSGAIDDFKGILTNLITEGGYANINSDFLNLPDSAKTALYLQTYRAVLNKQDGPTILNDIQNSILLYTLVFGNNNKGKVGVDESRREVMSWLMTAQPDFNAMNEDGTYPLVDMREKFSNFAAELAILYKSTNLRSSAAKGRGLYNIWEDFYNLLEGKGDLFTAGEKKSLQESINENFNIDYVPIRQNERNTLGGRGEASRAGRRGSESELGVGEQSEAGTAAADDRGRTDADIAEAVKDIDVEPTEAQKKAGNYKKGHVKIQGFDITIENPKGAIRKGIDDNGKAWSTEMKNHYGYFKNTEGKDGDHIDVFIGDNPNSKRIFVVDQINPKTKEFDESKVMLGFDTEDEAKKAYLSNYSKDWKGFKDITYVDIETFRDWLYDGAKQRKPFGEYSNIRFRSIKDINDRFNEELQQQIDGTLPKGHVYSLGMPNDILRSAGFPNVPIELSASHLEKKSIAAQHPFELKEIKSLVKALQDPMAVFAYGDKKKSQNIIVEIQHEGKNFVVGIHFNRKRGSAEISSIRGLYPKDNAEWLNWISQGKLLYVNKEKIQISIDQQRRNLADVEYLDLNYVAKVIKDFDNPTLSGEKNEETRFLSDISEIKPLVNKINGGLLKLKRMDTEGVYDLLRSVAELNNMANKGYYYLNVDEKLVNDKIYSLKERAVNKIAQELYNRDEYVGFDYNGVEKFDIVYFRDKQGRQISFHQYVTPEYVSDFTPIWDGITESWKDENIKFASKKNAELEKKKHIIGKKVREEYFKEIKDSEDELERDINNAGEDVRLIMKFGTDRALSQTSIFSDKFPDIAEQRKQLDNRQRDVNKKLRYLQTFILKKESVLSRSSKQDTIEKLKSEIEKIETERTELRTESRLIENKLNGIERVVSLKWRGLPEVKKATELAERQFSLRQKHFLAERDIVEKMKSATREINDKYGDNVNEEIEKNIRVKAERDEAQQENKKLEDLVTLLKKTGFADVKTGEDFYNALAEIGGSEHYLRPNGTVLGFVKGNTIYLNPDEVSLNTPIHEFGHLWVSQVKEHFPELWAKGKELFLESDYLRKVQADPNYQHLDLDGQIDEAMARAIGDRGEQELDKTLLEKILDWIAEVWEKIGGVFGINNLTSEQISNLTLQDFTDMATSELLSGQNLTERVKGNRGGATRYNTAEETADIKAKAISDGTFMKAPNGEGTNLTERQWLQVRTKAFKRWFGDWEKAARIEKLKKTKPIEITGEEYKGKYELNVKSGHKWILDNLRGTYTIKDTGEKVNLSRVSANEITSHGEREDIHLKSFAVIPQMIENAIFIEETDNYKGNSKYDKYKYYVVGLSVDGVPYTARIVVGEKNGKTYYDHELTQIEKGTIIDSLNGTTTSVAKNDNAFSEYKDKRLFSLLQTNSSKVVDENGEPMVVYHGTNKFGFTVFDKEFSDDKTSIFFTDRVDIAKGYAGVNADVRSLYDDDTAGGYSKDEILSMLFADVDISSHTNGWDVANDILPYITEDIGITAEYDDEDGVLTLSSDYTGDTYRLTDEEFSWEKVENWLRDNADLENVIDKDAGIYGVFVNARNVLDIDAGGSMWSSIPKKKVKGAEGVGNMDTRDIVEHAKKLNYDGVYIKDLLDTGGRGYGLVGDIEGDIFISLVDKNQIKSATDNIGTFDGENEDIRYSVEGADYFVNERFNEQLEKLTEENADSTMFRLGYPDMILQSTGIPNKELRLYGNKLLKKAEKHDFNVKDLVDLPTSIQTPMFVFKGNHPDSFSIVTELKIRDKNVLVSIERNKDGEVDFNLISSVYGKSGRGIVHWLNNGKALYVNKEKALDYLRISAPIAEAQDKGELNPSVSTEKALAWQAALAPIASATLKQELITATKIIENFENPPINEKKVIDDTTNDMVRYSIKASEQLDKEDEVMGERAAEIYEARVKMGKQMNQSNPNLMPNKKIFDEINEKTENRRAKIAEHAADCYLPMKHLIEVFNKHGYNIADYNNWYMNVFALAGKNEVEYEKYQTERSVPLQRAAKAAMDSGNITYRDLENYLILKHGQERNKYYKERDEKLGVKPMKDYSGTEAVMFEEFCKRTGIKVKTIEEDIPTLVDGDPNTIRYDNGKSEFSKDGKKIPDFEVNKRFELWRKQHTPEEIIKDYEEKIGKEKVEDLWSKIRKATQFTLDCQKEGGLTSEEMYQKASGMWEYFVPLRGFDMGTAQDEYDYDLNGITLFTDFRVEQTLGRTRRSVSPLAWTEQMAHITIQQKNKNLLNQSLRRLASVSMARKDNIMFLSKQYKAPDVIENGKVVREGALINPPAHTGNPTEDSAAFERWETSMKEGVKNGTVEVVEHSNVNFGMIVSADKVKQHVVRVYEGGRPVDIIFNTSPSVPRAINGLNNKTVVLNDWFSRQVKAGTRLIAQTMTTYNPAFVGKNFMRDYLFANTMLMGKEDRTYRANFNKNIVKAHSVMFDYVKGKSLLGWAAGDKGSVRDNEYGRWLTEFVMNGGKTGFSQMFKFEKMSSDFKKQTEKGDKKVHYGVNDYIHFIEAMNDYAENITRFSAYCASRQAGRSIERSISDAKELTINFNRKGTDGGIWGTVRSLCAFSNASIQALVVFSRGVKANPKRMSAFISGYTAMAITMAVIARLIGGDDDDYFKLSKYDRQNNLCLPMFGGGFVKIPLPQELRVFWKLGDEIALCIYRNEPPEVAAQEVFMGALDLLPSFAAGATSISDVLDEKIGAGELLLAHQPITIIQPATQLMTNRNFLNYRIYDDNKWGGRRKELPEYRKALRNKGGETYSPNFVVKLSEGIGRLTGGSDLKRGVVEVNPDVINHLMRGYFGGLYNTAVAAINVADKGYQSVTTGEWKLKSTDSPTMKAFYVSPSNLRYTDDILNAQYMDVLKEAKKHANVYANYLKEGEVDRFEKETKMTEDEALDWRYLVKGIDKEVQELRNEIATAETTKERDEALRQLEALQREAIEIAAKLKK